MAAPDSFGSLNTRSTCHVHIFAILDPCPCCTILESSTFSQTLISILLLIGLPWPYLHISSSSQSFLLRPLGTPVSRQTVLCHEPLHQMLLLPLSFNLYSPLLFLNCYSFSVSDNCSFEAYAVPLHLSFINISSCVNFSACFISNLTG